MFTAQFVCSKINSKICAKSKCRYITYNQKKNHTVLALLNVSSLPHTTQTPSISINTIKENFAPPQLKNKYTTQSLIAPELTITKYTDEYEQLKQIIAEDRVLYAMIRMNMKLMTYQTLDGDVHSYHWIGDFDQELANLMKEHNVIVKYDNELNVGNILHSAMDILLNGMYIVIGILLIRIFFGQMNGGRGNPMSSFTNAKPPVKPEEVKIKFDDVAGLENAKLEVMEVVEFVKNPERFVKVGAQIPKGILLSGGPGLGKTLLAKAIAGEAGVPFFAVSASSFIELFIGVGSSRVRSLFTSAKENAPCIVFIDELDAIGKARSANGGGIGGNDEREQTINQLLTEMDGFTENAGVVVISATNRPDILDPALVRPGRFDRLITLDPPTLKDREAILKIHTKNKPLSEDVDLQEIARTTVGLSGAELANIANEASILTARRNGDAVSMKDFAEAIDRVLLGPEKKNALISEKKKRIVAAHEAGHAVVGLMVGEYDEVTKISIVPRGKSGGVTMFEQSPENAESGLYSKQYLENRLAVALGGRAAEEICFGEENITTGAYSDMEVVQQLARSMVVNYGFSEKLGTVSWANKGNGFTSEFSNTTIAEIDAEVIALTKQAYNRAKTIIKANTRLFNEITEQVYLKELLDKNDIDTIIEQVWN
jgi:cell division protease FtsH